jgi:hypothetical protein
VRFGLGTDMQDMCCRERACEVWTGVLICKICAAGRGLVRFGLGARICEYCSPPKRNF